MYQYVLFDLDGTLTDPKIGICTSVQYALKDVGIEVENLDLLEPFIGPPLKDSFMKYYHMSAEEADQAIAKYRERFSTIGLYENTMYPGIDRLLNKLKESGISLAIASSKPTVFVEKILKHFELYDYFSVVVGSELDGRRGTKEEVVEEALFQLCGNKKEEYQSCVMIGDRKFDVEGAKAYGIDSIGVTYGYGGKEELRKAGVTYLADRVEELEQFLLPIRSVREKVRNWLRIIKEILGPVLIYWLITNTVMLVFVFYFRGMEETRFLSTSVVVNALGSIVAIPFLWRQFGKDSLSQSKRKHFFRVGVVEAMKIQTLLLFILGASSALALNMLFSYIDFPQIGNDYKQVEAVQYSVSLPVGIVIYGLIMPFAEELLFRGIVFTRMKQYFKAVYAIPASALLFGIYHGNLQQALYGFLMGSLMAYSYWVSGKFKNALILHMAANLTVFIITFVGNAETHINNPMNCFIFTIIFFFTFFISSKLESSS